MHFSSFFQYGGGMSSSSSVSSETDDSNNGPNTQRLMHYNTDLPLEHNYLGRNLEELRGRTLLDEGSMHVLPLLSQPGIVLVPGQTFPLMLFYPATVNMIMNVISTNGTFGILCIRFFESSSPSIANYGTTAEIYEYSNNLPDRALRAKAKGRQRFRVVDSERLSDGNLRGTIQILREAQLPSSLYESRLTCLDRNRSGPSNANPRSGENRLRTARQRRIARHDSIVTPWPHFVHDMYNADTLVRSVRNELSYLRQGSSEAQVGIPTDPVDLSYWVAQATPLNDEQKLDLLRLDSPIQRLRWELSILHKCQVIVCSDCEFPITEMRYAFTMNVEGPQGTYVNPGGFVHETLTVIRARGLKCVTHDASIDHSWFPGYAWIIAECRYCKKHMGWKFIALNSSLTPKKFWGICRRSVMMKFLADEEVELVM